MKRKQFCIATVLVGLAVYSAAYFFVPFPCLSNGESDPLSRGQLLAIFALHPQDWMLTSWFGSPPQFTFADRLPVLGAALLILGWAATAGGILLRLCRIDRGLGRIETFIFSSVIGLNLLSTWMLLVGLLGYMNRAWVVFAPMALTFIGGFIVWRYRERPIGSDSEPTPDEAGAAGAFWLLLAVPFLLAIALSAMLPPTDFDVCVYHLQAPKEFIQHGRITFLPHNVYANMPMGAEMLNMLAMLLTGDWWWGALVGKTVLAAFTPLCALAIFVAGRRFHSTTAGAVGAVVYVSIPWVVCLSAAGLVEGVSACYAFAALYALLLSQESSRSGNGNYIIRRIILSGYLAGAAVATKYPAVLFVVVPLATWIVVAKLWKIARTTILAADAAERSWTSMARTVVKPLAVFVLAACLGCGLWIGKNWAMTGNPTYPLLAEVFGGKTRDAEKISQWRNAHTAHDFSIETFGKDITRIFLTSEWISPLIVPLVLLAFFRRDTFRFDWVLLLYAGFVIVAWWTLTHRIDRFWMPITPILALLAGMGACWNRDGWWRRALAAFMFLGLVGNFIMVASDRGNAWFLPLAQLRNDPHWISPWHWYFNNKAGKEGAVLAVGNAAVFNIKQRVFYNTCFDDCVLEQLVKGKTPDEIRRDLAIRNIVYVLVNWEEISRYRNTYGFSNFVQPAVFEKLVRDRILTPLPPMKGCWQQVFEVSDALSISSNCRPLILDHGKRPSTTTPLSLWKRGRG